MTKNNWTRDELILAFNLYCKIPFTKINDTYKPVIELSEIIGRTPGAVSFKLANYARLDPALQRRDVSGLKHGSKGEEEIWNEFHGNWEELSFESEKLLSQYSGKQLEQLSEIETYDLPKEGEEREALVKIRVNQNFFRKTVLTSYSSRCCITGIQNPQLLVASHIIPWSEIAEHRMKPENGLCLNALHDRAFDKGLITISDDFKVIISKKIIEDKDEAVKTFFLPFHGKEIIKPNRFVPDISFLEYHRNKFAVNF